MELLSSTGSTAAALTLNRTPMRAANTTRSCMLWRECTTSATGAREGGSHRKGCACASWSLNGSDYSEVQKSEEQKVQCSWSAASHRFWRPQMFLLLYLRSPQLFYTPLPPLLLTLRAVGVWRCTNACRWSCGTWAKRRRGRWRGQPMKSFQS